MKKMLLLACLCALLVPAAAAAQDPPKPEVKADKTDVTGVWDMLIETPQGQMNIVLTLKQEGEKLTGTQASPMGEIALEGTVVGAEVKYAVTIDMQGQQMTVAFGAKVEGDTMNGVYDFGGMGSGAWTAKKRPA
jgi:opacity protein-like surface antigen